MNAKAQVPQAEKKPKALMHHNHTRIDNYYWLNEKENEEVIEYLNSENSYLNQYMSDTVEFQDKLFLEMTGKLKQDDASVPYIKKGYYYYTRYEPNKEYPIYCRKEGSLDNKEQIILNVNELAKGKSYYDVKGLSISPNNLCIAFGVDLVGRRLYKIYTKNLETEVITETTIDNCTGSITWSNDNKTVFYTKKDTETLRSCQILRKNIFDDSSIEHLVFEEKDETFITSVNKTKSEKYIIIGSHSTVSDEFRIIPANDPLGKFKIFQSRERDFEYGIYHYNNKFYINTNWNAANFRLMETSEDCTEKENWKEVIPHRNDVLIEGVSIFSNHLVITERGNAQLKIRIIDQKDQSDHYIDVDEEAYSIYVSVNPEFNTSILRFGYYSMTTPVSIFDYNMDDRSKKLLKVQEVLGDFDKSNYRSKRFFAKTNDGEEVPISMVYHKNTELNHENPLLLYGYGSYGNTIDPYFSIARLSLLDRGFIFAIAHIRGGEIRGRKWYEDGKMLNKINTFDDFITCSNYLIDKKYTSPDKLYAMGGSAGGLLLGAVINMAPQLFKGIVAAVPFVDVLTTMLDPSIPLTTGEYDEWGNPEIKKYYDYILKYSPYDNIKPMKYPAMMVTAGLHDSQVQYWEPAKWVAKLRELKTDDNPLLLYTDMDSGHGGTTGRFKPYKDTALEYAFLLKLEGITE